MDKLYVPTLLLSTSGDRIGRAADWTANAYNQKFTGKERERSDGGVPRG